MRCWVLPGSVQLQDYYIRPEKMGAPRKDLADAILSYNGNDSQKSGEPFFKLLSAIASSPRRRAIEAPVNTYSALSSSKELPPVSITHSVAGIDPPTRKW